ncbi:A-kinase anchor protein 14 [Nycticebus coucang]|uniref:A-kinase anchor protein 14 n=1 Tax=Nycticebus coucang TaxID=9470 RepID=UPI00234DB71D|nr:A-kinase anchor protein 14 [Nycticebus coucang]
MDVNNIPTSQRRVDKPDDSKVNKIALAVVKDAIHAAVNFVTDIEYPIRNIRWITHGEFTAERGRRQIDAYVLTWEYQSRWVHCTEFVERRDLIHTFHYIYFVHWSIPTARRPMARVTAAAKFIIRITKGKPPEAPIEVSYSFEAHSLVQRPGMIRFREQWLRNIIEAKNILMESLPF